MNNELLLFTNELGFEKAVFYAKSKGYTWVANSKVDFRRLLTDLPRNTKEYAINIYYNIYNGQKEMAYQTRDFYLRNENNKTRFTNIQEF